MGPITLFDKSFLQSLSEDESMWFDNFFLANVCPIFYVETLADLGKAVRSDRTPEQEVGLIADKFPEMQCGLCAHHAILCFNNLMGRDIPMTGQIPLPPGKHLVKSDMGIGYVFQESPETEAFLRWRNREFEEIERLYARRWRESLGSLDLGRIAEFFSSRGLNAKSCTSLLQAKTYAERIVRSWENTLDGMKAALTCLNMSRSASNQIIDLWISLGCPPLTDYAPYAAYVLTVELFFRISLASKHISTSRPSGRMDIAYLYYLPFCQAFVSSDNLHRRCAPLFLRDNQEFVWGEDLKVALSKLNALYMQFPEETRFKGIMSFAGEPPKEGNCLVQTLWDRYHPGWRRKKKETLPRDSLEQAELIRKLNKVAQSPRVEPSGEEELAMGDPRFMLFQRRVHLKRGNWYQLPKGFRSDE